MKKERRMAQVCASDYKIIMDFEDYLNGYENALKMPHEAFHAYCMNMRKAAPMDERISLQINYRCLLLAAELQEKKEIRKRNEK